MTTTSLTAGRIVNVNGGEQPESGAEIVARLVRGDKAAWDAFVQRYSPVIYAAVRRTLAKARHGNADAADVAQDVFLRLCKDEFRLLRKYQPERASLSTWLTVVSTSTTLDSMRRRRRIQVSLDDVPEDLMSVNPVEPVDRLQIPSGLLSPRQALVMKLLFEHDMDVAEAADLIGVDRQTIRSTQHKALVKLRSHFRDEAGGEG